MGIDRRVTGLVFLFLLGPLAGCGSHQRTSDPGPGVEAPSKAAPAVLVGCGAGPGWSPAVMADGVDSEFTDEAAATFATLLSEPDLGKELRLGFLADGPDTEFRVLRDDGDAVTLGLGRWTDERGPVGDAIVMSLSRDHAEGWRFESGGDCRLEPVLDAGETWVELSGPVSTTDDGRTLELQVSERECTSARDPRPHLREPVLAETTGAVVVSWTSTAMRARRLVRATRWSRSRSPSTHHSATGPCSTAPSGRPAPSPSRLSSRSPRGSCRG